MTTAPGNPERRNVPAPRRFRAVLRVGMRLLVSGVLLGFFLQEIDLGTTRSVLGGTRFDLLLLLIAVFLGERFLSAYRWHVLVRLRRPDVPFVAVLRATFVSGFLGTFLPGAVGMEAMRVVTMTRSTSDLSLAFTSVFLDRLFGMLALMVVAVSGVLLAPQALPSEAVTTVWALFGMLVVGVGTILSPVLRTATERLLSASSLEWLRDKSLKLVVQVEDLRRRPVTLSWAIVLACAFQVVRVGIAPLAAVALGVHVPLVYYLVYVPAILIAMMLPISIGGLGVREAGFVLLFSPELMSAEAAFSLSVLVFGLGLASQLPGVVLLFATRRRNEPSVDRSPRNAR